MARERSYHLLPYRRAGTAAAAVQTFAGRSNSDSALMYVGITGYPGHSRWQRVREFR
jgi:hypothetical protein